MPKTCEYKGCSNPIWSRKTMRCKYHMIQKRNTKEYVGINDYKVNKEVELYQLVWKDRDKRSFLSGQKINIEEGSSFWYNIFAHVLAKGKANYPKFRLYSKNIILLTPYEHMLLDHGSEAQRKVYAGVTGCDWNKVFDLKEELKLEYKTIFS